MLVDVLYCINTDLHSCQPLDVLMGKVSLALLFALSHAHVYLPPAPHPAIQPLYGIHGFLRRPEAHEAKAFGAAILHHHL